MDHPPEILACAIRLGLPASALPALRELWEAASREALRGGGSGLTTYVEPLATLDHGSDAPWRAPARPATRRAPPEAAGGPSPPWAESPARRYERLGLLGRGGMAEVWRVRDLALNRAVAMKVIRPELADRDTLLARFIQEAQCTAQLQHPGVVPVHELGRLPNGTHYFTMAEVRGRTLTEVIREVHDASRGDRWEPGPSGWTFPRLVEAFHRVCETVGYAHEHGVVHRDLKPDNVMLGSHGEVLVVDWGLAKVLGRRDLPAEAGPLDTMVTDRSQDGDLATRVGAVAGTPAYMPPEQARGEIDRIDARSDVYALGAILYHLMSGRPPYDGENATAVLHKVLTGPPPPVGRVVGVTATFGLAPDTPAPPEATAGPPLPEDLVAAMERAMARDPADRFAHAGELAAEVAAWLGGARRREQALEVVERSLALGWDAARLRRRAAALREEAARLLASYRPWEPEEVKAPGWAKEDEARALEREADRQELRAEQGLYAALRIDATLPEAHAALAERHLAAHATAEAARDDDTAARAELALSEHVSALPAGHPVRQRCAAYLKGTGALTLLTDPPGAQVLLYRYETRNRRLVPVFERSLGTTPLSEVALDKGSYLCILKHPERVETRYPILIERQGHWDGVPPGARAPHPIYLPRTGELAPDDRYVPAGWFWSGGDPDAADGLPRRRLWCPDLVVKCFPVTNREYIAFLEDLLASGREEEALRHAPRERAGKEGEVGPLIYGRRPDGGFELVPDADGDLWLPDHAVCMVDWWGAVAYADWLAARSGQPWRLPGELEWEKAARGVDGRFFPWGDLLDPSWCCMRDSHRGRPLPMVVDTFPTDESPCGVRGIAGGVRDWCADVYRREGPPVVDGRVDILAEDGVREPVLRPVRGGAWSVFARQARISDRNGVEPWVRTPYFGFRVVRNLRKRHSARARMEPSPSPTARPSAPDEGSDRARPHQAAPPFHPDPAPCVHLHPGNPSWRRWPSPSPACSRPSSTRAG